MARPARREPTNRELDERVTKLEHQVAEIATTLTRTNEVAVREIAEFRRAFVEHREEVRRALAETATRELVIREVSGLRAELRGELQNLRTELGGKTRDLQAGLDELRVVGDGRQALADQRHAEIMGQFEKLFSGPRQN
jgi:chromosome segregation ATPase